MSIIHKSFRGIQITILFLTLTLFSNGQGILWDSTFVVQDIPFKVIAGSIETGSYAKIIRDHLDTTTINGVNGNIEILKFDEDSYPDIRLSYLGNNIIADLFLFDTVTHNFKQVKGFELVPAANRLKTNTKYFYSYQRAGCADMNWVSKLFYIRDFKVVQIGEIYGKGCDQVDSLNKIEITKIITPDQIITIETLPIDTIEKFDNYKWGFIEDYWNKHYSNFKNSDAL